MKFELKRTRIGTLSKEQILAALMKAADHFKFIEFGMREFTEGKFGCTSETVRLRFGSWRAGINALREELARTGQKLADRSRDRIPETELFAEMERIWRLVGQRPSKYQWEEHSPLYGYATYKSRFGGWLPACLSFIEYRMGRPEETEQEIESSASQVQQESPSKAPIVRETVTSRLRLQVLDRDGFTCVLCGRSPATERGVQLHIDHILPVSRGGRATYENLRTLCARCNLGRGNISQLGA
jgi:hypothetical protein